MTSLARHNGPGWARHPARLLRRLSAAAGINPRGITDRIRSVPIYVFNLNRYRGRQHEVQDSLRLRFGYLNPQLRDRWQQAGAASGHYFHQDVWAARRVFESNPSRHVDVGSRIDGFVAHLLAFREVEVVDLRPLTTSQPGLRFTRASILSLPYADASLPSISSLHTVEHVGLGRYGDPIDPGGPFAAMSELARVLASQGRLYLSVPVGVERTEFDAHRVFSPITILKHLEHLALVEFSAVDDAGGYIEHADPEAFVDAQYSCGLFVFSRQE